MKYFIAGLALYLFTLIAGAQPWLTQKNSLEKRAGDRQNFHHIQSSFEDYWEGKPYEKGRGYKQFKRWEWFTEPRVYPSGDLTLVKNKVEVEMESETDVLETRWEYTGPVNLPHLRSSPKWKIGMGRLNCIAFHPEDPGTFWVGSPAGGLWKTKDGGESFYPTTDFLSSIGITDIAVHPHHPDILFVITGDRDSRDSQSIGIYKSLDGGESFLPTAVTYQASDYMYMNRLVMDPTDPDRQYAATSKGIIYTTDSWESYKRAAVTSDNLDVSEGNFMDLKMHPTNPSILYASLQDPWKREASVYRSTDSGVTFTRIVESMGFPDEKDLGRIELAVTPAEPDLVYALVSSAESGDHYGGFHGLYLSRNAGRLWLPVNTFQYREENYIRLGDKKPGGQAWFDLVIAAHPTRAGEVWVGGLILFKSNDYGKNFRRSDLEANSEGWVTSINVDKHALAFHPSTHQLYTCHDGGLSRTQFNTPDTVNWKTLDSRNLGILQIYRTATIQWPPYGGISGTQDQGVMSKSGDIWARWRAGDGMECAISRNGTVYFSTQYGSLYKTNDWGQTQEEIGPRDIAGKGNWLVPFELAYENEKHLIIGYENLYETNDGGYSWKSLTDRNSTSAIDVLAWASLNSDRILYSDGSELHQTTNRGESWNRIDQELPQLWITDITLSFWHDNHIWVSFSGYEAGQKIYESRDGGATWTNISEGLPNLPVNVIKAHAGTVENLYAGTDAGVYYRNETMDRWIKMGDALPHSPVTDLDIIPQPHKLVVSTYGRGLWQTDLVLDPSTVHLNFLSSRSQYCPGNEIQFYYEGTNYYDSLRWEFAGALEGHRSKDEHPVLISSDTGWVDVKLSVFIQGKTFTHEKKASIRVGPQLNDRICMALPLNYGWNGSFSNTCATAEENEPQAPASGCTSQEGWCENEVVHNSLWFRFTADKSGEARIQSAGFDTQMALYEAASCEDLLSGNYTLLAANDDYDPGDYSATIETISGLTPGREYWVQVDGSFGGAEGDFWIFLTSGIFTGEDHMPEELKDQLLVYPNPGDGLFRIVMPHTSDLGLLQVWNSSGQLVNEEKLENILLGSEHILDLSKKEAGIYFLLLETDGRSFHSTLVKE